MKILVFLAFTSFLVALVSADEGAKVQCPVIVFDSRTLFTGFGHYNYRPWKHLNIAPFITFKKYQKEILVGQEAFQEAHSHMQGSFYINDIKKLIGKSFKNPEVQSLLATLPNIAFEKRGRAHFKVTYGGREEEFDSEAILGFYLSRLRDAYEKELSAEVKKKEFLQTVYFISTMALKEADKSIDGYTQAFLNGGYKLSRVIEEPIAVVKGTGLQRVAENFLTIVLDGQSFEMAVVRRTDEQSLTILGRLIEKNLGGPKYCEEAHWDEINANRSTGFLIQNAKDAFFNDAEGARIHHHESESSELAKKYSETVVNAIQQILKKVNLKRENVDHVIISGDLPRGIHLKDHRPIVREVTQKNFQSLFYPLIQLLDPRASEKVFRENKSAAFLRLRHSRS